MHKSSPLPSIRNQAEVVGNQHGRTRPCCSDWGIRRKSTDSGSRDEYPGSYAGMLSGHAEMGSGKLRCTCNWTWQGIWRITVMDSLDTLVRRDRLRRMYPSDKLGGRTGFNKHGEGCGIQWGFCFGLHWLPGFPYTCVGLHCQMWLGRTSTIQKKSSLICLLVSSLEKKQG